MFRCKRRKGLSWKKTDEETCNHEARVHSPTTTHQEKSTYREDEPNEAWISGNKDPHSNRKSAWKKVQIGGGYTQREGLKKAELKYRDS